MSTGAVVANRTEILALYDRDLRADWVVPEAKREVVVAEDGRVVLVGWLREDVGTSTVSYSDLLRLDRADLEGVVDGHLERARARGLRSYWKLHDHDAPSELRALLASRGYVSDNDPGDEGPVMFRDLSNGSLPELSVSNVDVRRVGPESFDQVTAVEQRIYGGDFGWLGQRLAVHAEIPGFLSVYVAYVAEEPACVGWTYLHPEGRFVALRGGGTVPEHRRKGLYAAVMVARLREAGDRGFAYAVVEPSPMNVPVVRSFAFETLTHATDLVHEP